MGKRAMIFNPQSEKNRSLTGSDQIAYLCPPVCRSVMPSMKVCQNNIHSKISSQRSLELGSEVRQFWSQILGPKHGNYVLPVPHPKLRDFLEKTVSSHTMRMSNLQTLQNAISRRALTQYIEATWKCLGLVVTNPLTNLLGY